MGVVKEVLAPSMKDRKKPDLRTEVLGVGSDSPQSLCSCAEHNIVHGAGILECDRCDLVGYGESNVKILRIEKLGLSGLDPFCARERLALGAVARAAAIVGDPPLSAVIALLDMATERGRSAALDRRHCCTSFGR